MFWPNKRKLLKKQLQWEAEYKAWRERRIKEAAALAAEMKQWPSVFDICMSCLAGNGELPLTQPKPATKPVVLPAPDSCCSRCLKPIPTGTRPVYRVTNVSGGNVVLVYCVICNEYLKLNSNLIAEIDKTEEMMRRYEQQLRKKYEAQYVYGRRMPR